MGDEDEEEEVTEDESTADESSVGGTPAPKTKVGWGTLKTPQKAPTLEVSDSEGESVTPTPSVQAAGGGKSPWEVSDSESEIASPFPASGAGATPGHSNYEVSGSESESPRT